VFNAALGKKLLGVSPEAMAALLLYDYPGNIRELENTIEHAFILCKDGLISPWHLPDRFRHQTLAVPVIGEMTLVESEKFMITQALEQNEWKTMATARQLGIDKNTLRRKLLKHGIHKPKA
jgi:transcriptional regulator of acetoin/glycerol metabolism